MRIRAAALIAFVVAGSAAACYKPPPEAMTLESGTLTVRNHSRTEWTNVEVRLNSHYRMTAKSILPGGSVQAPLDRFVAGFGQHFIFSRMQVRDLRLTATLPDGKPLEIKKEFEQDGLTGALVGMSKKK